MYYRHDLPPFLVGPRYVRDAIFAEKQAARSGTTCQLQGWKLGNRDTKFAAELIGRAETPGRHQHPMHPVVMVWTRVVRRHDCVMEADEAIDK
ncbi:hypothetical protein B8X02_01455 [Stenotrophomonas rhizophila]|nr:hypothetical protein B8X02_01455 [Stenotrophomonas rhizophila]